MFQKSAFLKCIQNSKSTTDLTLFNPSTTIFTQHTFNNSKEASGKKLEKKAKKNKASFLAKLKRCRSKTKSTKRQKAVDLSFGVFKTSINSAMSSSSSNSNGVLLSSTLLCHNTTATNNTIEMNRRLAQTSNYYYHPLHFSRSIYQDDICWSDDEDDFDDDDDSICSSNDVTIEMDSSLSSVSSLEFEPFESVHSSVSTIKRKSFIKDPLISSSRSTLRLTPTRKETVRKIRSYRPVSSSRKSLLLNNNNNYNTSSCNLSMNHMNISSSTSTTTISPVTYCSYCRLDAATAVNTSNICSSTLISTAATSSSDLMRNLIRIDSCSVLSSI